MFALLTITALDINARHPLGSYIIHTLQTINALDNKQETATRSASCSMQCVLSMYAKQS